MDNLAIPQPIPSVYPLDVTRGCILYYDMQDLGGKIIDHSGHGYHGIASGAAAVAGLYGLVRSFDGIDDRITVTNTIDWSVSPISVELWVRQTAFTKTEYFFAMHSGTTSRIGISISNTGVVTFSRAAATRAMSRTTAIDPNPELHLVFTHDGVVTNASAAKIYLNGAEVESYASTTDGIGAALSVADNWSVGGWLLDNTKALTGKIGLVRVYNRALSAVEVSAAYRESAWRYGVAA